MQKQSKLHPPFSMQFTPQAFDVLKGLNCSLAISTYQAGKLIFISPGQNENLIQLPRTFPKAMGIACAENRLALAVKDSVIQFKNVPELAKTYPKKPLTYDAMYVPRATYYTGLVDIHDLHYGTNNNLYAVNTLFSCISKIDANHSFTPIWKPHFIDDIKAEDRCHLNGLAMVSGEPKYATAFNAGNTPQSWRAEVGTAGLLLDIQSQQMVAQGLRMPHSPRFINGSLYVLYSATGQLMCIDLKTGVAKEVLSLGAFVRGMAYYKDYLFIGTNKIRTKSSSFSHLKIAKQSQQAGIKIIHLPTASLIAEINYLASVDEIYDIQVLPNMLRPNILNTQTEDHLQCLDLPEKTFWGRPKKDITHP